MRLSRPFALSVAALAAVAGVAAYAERPAVHVATYALPGGGVVHVRYTGDTPPRLVAIDPAAAALASPFAGLDGGGFDRIAAMMDAQADAMLAQASAMMGHAAAMPAGAQSTAMRDAALAAAPVGARWTEVTRTVTNGKVCTTQVSSVAQGEGEAPRLLRKVSGDCAGAAAAPATPVPPAVPPKPAGVPRDTI